MGKESRNPVEYRLQACFNQKNFLNLLRLPFYCLLIALFSLFGCDNLFTKPPLEGDNFETPLRGSIF